MQAYVGVKFFEHKMNYFFEEPNIVVFKLTLYYFFVLGPMCMVAKEQPEKRNT